VALAIDLVDHRGECGRLAGAGRACDEYETARLVADFLDDGGESELAKAEDFVGNLAVNGGRRTALIEDVRAESSEAFDAEREVELEVLLDASCFVSGAVSAGISSGVSLPSIRICGAELVVTCRSEPPRSTMVLSS
jgi:hypothetical protein